jgi:hypothetical protein
MDVHKCESASVAHPNHMSKPFVYQEAASRQCCARSAVGSVLSEASLCGGCGVHADLLGFATQLLQGACFLLVEIL